MRHQHQLEDYLTHLVCRLSAVRRARHMSPDRPARDVTVSAVNP
jgi:hypothetical protein